MSLYISFFRLNKRPKTPEFGQTHMDFLKCSFCEFDFALFHSISSCFLQPALRRLTCLTAFSLPFCLVFRLSDALFIQLTALTFRRRQLRRFLVSLSRPISAPTPLHPQQLPDFSSFSPFQAQKKSSAHLRSPKDNIFVKTRNSVSP